MVKPQTDKTQPTPMAALAIAALGVCVTALGLGIIPVPLHALHAPLWVMTAIGCALFFGGVAVELQCLGLNKLWFYKIVIAIILVAMITPFAWIVFGDSHLNLLFRIAFASPFAITILLLLPFGKTKIVANLEGKTMSEILRERQSEPRALQERKSRADDNDGTKP